MRFSRRLAAATAGVLCLSAAVVGITHLTPTAAASDASAPIRAAFYYPWFPETWHSTDHYHPSLGQYDSSDQAVVDRQFAAMRYGGLDAAISSWWGQGQHSEQTRFPMELAAAAKNGMGVAPYYEKEGTSNTSLATIRSDLAYLEAYAQADPSGFLHVDGKPVIFVYNAAASTSTCSDVAKWKTATNGFTDWYVNMKVFSGYRRCADQPSSWHQYGPAAATDQQGSDSYTVSPGFYKYSESTRRLARDLTRFRSDLAAMTASDSTWQLITTFDEWGEGTSVESATEWASASGYGEYLDAMHAALAGGTAPSATATPTASPTPTPTPTAAASPSPTATSSPPPAPSPTSAPTAGAVTKLLVFMEENHSLSEMKSGMPYTFSLAQQYGYATAYRAITHPSLPNYLAIAGGSTTGVSDDGSPSSHPVAGASVFGQAIAAGKTAKTYADSMTSDCQQSSSGSYAVKHNPWAYYTGSAERSGCGSFDVPVAQLATDAAAGQLPDVGMVVPNLCNDAHDCSLGTADSWFKAAMQHVFAGPDWKSGHLAVVLTADEDDSSQGNTVLTVVIHPSQKGNVVSTPLTHYSLTRLYEEVAGTSFLNNAATAPDMASAFGLPLR